MKNIIFNRPSRIGEGFLKKIIEQVFRGERRKGESVEIVFLTEAEIKKLNFRYRQKNRPTDTLSFTEKPLIRFPRHLKEKGLGQVVICDKVVAGNARKASQFFETELTRVLIHSLLHLLGYEHERGGKDAKIMMAKQEKYLSHIN